MVELIFNKDIYKITLDDLIIFFQSEQEETALLEFKSGDTSVEDIYKEVTAFVNTEGGILIIGAPKEKKIEEGKKLIRAYCQGDLTPSLIKSKDTLYQKLATNIIPAPINIKIQEFIYQTGKCFILDIPKSIDPPHQCGSDGKYYIRLEREAKFAPHGIVQALFNQRKKVHLECKIYQGFSAFNDTHFFEVAIRNTMYLPAEDVQYFVSVIGEDLKLDSNTFSSEIRGTHTEYFYKHNASQYLVAGITSTARFDFINNGEWFYILVLYWAKDTEAKTKIYKYEKGKYIIQNSGEANNDILLEYKALIGDRWTNID